jgi:hypothetical protein
VHGGSLLLQDWNASLGSYNMSTKCSQGRGYLNLFLRFHKLTIRSGALGVKGLYGEGKAAILTVLSAGNLIYLYFILILLSVSCQGIRLFKILY